MITRRPRLGLRGRLTLLYGGLILAAGSLILAGIYVVVGQRLDQELGSDATEARIAALRERAAASGDSTIVLPDGSTVQLDVLITQLEQDRAALRDAALAAIVSQGAVVVLVVAVAAGAGGWIIAGRGLRPLDLMTATAERIARATGPERNLHERIGLTQGAGTAPNDEVRRLATAFDAMLDSLDRAFDGQRHFVANASHQLRTPLAVQRATIEVEITRPGAAPGTVALGARLLEQIETNARLIDGLLVLAESENRVEQVEPLDLADTAGAAVASVQQADRSELVINTDLRPAPASGDPLLLEQLIRNLVENALRYNVSGGTVMITTGVADDHAVIRVRNTGPVVDPADLPGLLEPFTRGPGRRRRDQDGAPVAGHGLGLAVVTAITAAHGGRLDLTPRPGGGLCVTVSLPATNASSC
ncbi:sensor histidine kinase [Microlunatus parietis]|uniref:histidine kinase n=1 Tax=Microlunatus parietis TaxID=682979 RepID=A0A7Y9LEU9_9ACTN|nr:HAMP domain-containing sensor histidine kinase [Microlunatus parietis]NYE73411.1 signal transduction histidine kinase [Microlunatus parietis]